jgi:hypothetical protein
VAAGFFCGAGGSPRDTSAIADRRFEIADCSKRISMTQICCSITTTLLEFALGADRNHLGKGLEEGEALLAIRSPNTAVEQTI